VHAGYEFTKIFQAVNRKNRFQRLVQKKCGVCFDGAYATKMLVPRLHIALLLSCSGMGFKKTRNFKLCKFKTSQKGARNCLFIIFDQ
jgi:hypothetical protein